MFSSGDTTGCVFTQDVSWGDGTDTSMTYVGGVNETPMATFTHAYGAPGSFQINFTIDVTDNPNGNCAGNSGALDFTLAAPPTLPCVPSQVTVPASMVSAPHAVGPLSIIYGPMPMTFTPGTATVGKQCVMQPAIGALPIDLKVPNAATPIRLGQSDTKATIDLFPASSLVPAVPECDFSALAALATPDITPPLTDFARTNNCLLTPTFHASWDVIAQWTVPEIVQMAHIQATNSDTAIYTTQPLTYYVDLDTMPLPAGFSGDTMSALVDFIYSTLAQNLPVLDRIALIGASSPHLLVTTPFGRPIGRDGNNRIHTFAGVGYAEVGGRSIAWILEPVLGHYHVSVRGRPGSRFGLDLTDLQFLGHGSDPLVENLTWNGTLGASGTAARRFHVHGTALSPMLAAHESRTRVPPLRRVHFTLAGSVITLGAAKILWLFGDGARATGMLAAHRYNKQGRFTPTVTVTDAVGYTATVKLPVIVVRS